MSLVSFGEIQVTLYTIKVPRQIITKENCKALTITNRGDFILLVTSQGGTAELERKESIVVGGHTNFVRREQIDIDFGALLPNPPASPIKKALVMQDNIVKPPEIEIG